MALRPTVQRLNPELHTALMSQGDPDEVSGSKRMQKYVAGVCEHYGIERPKGSNLVAFSEELEAAVVAAHNEQPS